MGRGCRGTAGASSASFSSVVNISRLFRRSVTAAASGVVKEINEDLLENPQRINEAPYEAWFIKVGEITEEEEYLTAEAYEAFAAEEAEG